MLDFIIEVSMDTNEDEEQKSDFTNQCVGWIAANDLQRFKGRVVTIVGQNISEYKDEETQFRFEDAHGTKFKVLVAKDAFEGFDQGTVVEITGRVLSSYTVLLQQYTDWGDKANLKLWGELLKLTKKFPGIF